MSDSIQLTCGQAGKLIGVTDQTVRNYIARGLLPARREGVMQIRKIDVEDLREFARQYDYRFNEDLYRQMIQD